MKIVKLEIKEFGGLKDKTLELSDGLNVLYGKNESGKSTVALFIRFMLYGLPKKSAKSTDRERSISWSGGRAEGSMEVEYRSVRYRIERRAVTSGARVNESLSFTDLGTGEKISGEPGTIFFGVPLEIYESSSSISQMKIAQINGEKTVSAIENMLVSADEDIDVSRVLAALDKVRREYRLNRGEGGIIFDTESEISRLKVRLSEATQKYLNYNGTSGELDRAKRSMEDIDAQRKQSSEMLSQINDALTLRRFLELDEKKKRLEATKTDLSDLEREESRNNAVPTEAHSQALKQARLALNEASVKCIYKKREYDALPTIDEQKLPLAKKGEEIRAAGGKAEYISRAVELDRKAKSKKKTGAVLLTGAIVAAALGVGLALLNVMITAGVCGLSAVLLCIAVAMLSGAKKLRADRDAVSLELGAPFDGLDGFAEDCLLALGERERAEAKSSACLALLKDAENDVSERYSKLSELLCMTVDKNDIKQDSIKDICLSEEQRINGFAERQRELRKDIYGLEMLVSAEEERLCEYDREALASSLTLDVSTLTPKIIEDAKEKERFDSQRYEIIRRKVQNLSESLATLRGGISESPAEIADRIAELEDKLEKSEEYYDALMLAKEHIEKASESMSSGVTPVISNTAGQLMARICDGAHSSVQTNKSLDLSVEQDGFHIDSGLLSGGTRDAAYIALRISLMMRLFGEELPPLVMDEALCQLDDVRALNMLKMLSDLCDGSVQCLLFTCHRREAQLCAQNGLQVNDVLL